MYVWPDCRVRMIYSEVDCGSHLPSRNLIFFLYVGKEMRKKELRKVTENSI